MNRYWFALPIGLTLILSGCNMAPDYTRPEAPIPSDWPQGSAYRQDDAAEAIPAAAEIPWQDYYTDPELQTIIQMALENNRDLRLAILNVEQVRALYGVQRAELLPALSAAGTASKQRESADFISPGQDRTSKYFSVDLGIASWEIDFFGRIRNLEAQALQDYLATEQARRGAQISLVSEVARAYLTLAANQENLNLAQSTLETQQNTYDLIQRQYDAEIANELALLRAKTQVDTAKVDVARYAQLCAQGRNALALLAGEPVPEELLPADLADFQTPATITTGVPSEVLLQRPDIMAAEYQLKGAYAFIGAARAAFFPRISLTTTIGTASNELSGLFESGSGTWSFAPQASLPIFDARVWAAYRVSESLQKIAVTEYEKAIQTAFREIADTLAVRGTVNEQVMAQRAIVASTEKIYDLSHKRYTNGIDSYLSVLDAQRSLYGAQQGLIALELARLNNDIRFYAVLGGGGNEAEPAETAENESEAVKSAQNQKE